MAHLARLIGWRLSILTEALSAHFTNPATVHENIPAGRTNRDVESAGWRIQGYVAGFVSEIGSADGASFWAS